MKFSRGNSRVTQLLLSFARSQELQKKLIKFEPQGSHLHGLREVGSTW